MTKHNHGEVRTKADGMTIVEPFGKDSSNWTGSAKDERGGKMGGSIDNMSDSLSNKR